jgi:hypothetical protein
MLIYLCSGRRKTWIIVSINYRMVVRYGLPLLILVIPLGDPTVRKLDILRIEAGGESVPLWHFWRCTFVRRPGFPELVRLRRVRKTTLQRHFCDTSLGISENSSCSTAMSSHASVFNGRQGSRIRLSDSAPLPDHTKY